MSYVFSDLKTKLRTQIGDANLSDSVAGDALNYTQQSLFNTFDLSLNSAQSTNTVTTGTNTVYKSTHNLSCWVCGESKESLHDPRQVQGYVPRRRINWLRPSNILDILDKR